ncbi:MAG: hypothetical protein LBD75_03415 [Candidatus Peribacteria bacterium]|nr:hypothetical protein [Candidatus Peribacteria bacterium]
MGEEELTALFSNLPRNLLSLDLSNNDLEQMDETIFEFFITQLSELPQLQYINLRANPFSDEQKDFITQKH